MADGLANLYKAISERSADCVLGWRGSTSVNNVQFLSRVRAWHALLSEQPGKNFALYLDDSIEFGAALLGSWHAGKTIWLSADTLESTCASLRTSVDGFLGQFPDVLQPLTPAPDDAAQVHAKLEVSCLSLELPALVVFTSGSTGAAQAIPKKLSQQASEVETLELLFGEAVGDAAVFATVSHQHIYGLLFKVLWPLCSARAVHAVSISYPEQLVQVLSNCPSVLISSPAHLKRLPAHLDWQGAACMLRAVFSSGGPLMSEEAFRMGELLGKMPFEVYGSSETGGIAWRQRSASGDDSWLPFPTLEWRSGADGVFEVRSPHLADDNWLALADRAQGIDERRFLLLGRSDRIVKIEEKRVSLTAMEAALNASRLVAEARVVQSDPVAGSRSRLTAFVVLTEEGRTVLDEQGRVVLNAQLRAVLSVAVDAVALPRRWRYLDQMPLNAQGKTTQADLLALFDNEDAITAQRPRFPRMRELERTPQRVVLELTAPPDLLYFDGHFDVAPVLPGVVQVEWAIHYGRQYFELPAHFKGISALKFQQVIRPDQPARLELLHDSLNGYLNFSYLSGAGRHASGRVLLRAEDAHV